MRGYIFLITALLLIGIIGTASAQIATIPKVNVRECAILYQTCANCTYSNITSITVQGNASKLITNKVMTKEGFEYNYTFCDTSRIGEYIVNGVSNPNGKYQVWSYNFYVTGGTIAFYFLIFGIALLLGLIGYYKRDYAFSALSFFALVFIGIYMLFNGFDIYKNYLTNAFSILILAGAGYMGVMLGLEYIDESKL